MSRWLISMLSLCQVAQGSSIDIQRSDIDYHNGQLIVDYQLALAVDPEKVKKLLWDYENFPKISRLIVESHVRYENSHKTILQQQLKPCVMGICYKLNKEQQLYINEDGSVSAVFTEEQAFFDGGFEQWDISQNDQGTVIHYRANVTPTFPVPPFIGTWFVRHFIDNEIKFVAKNIIARCS